MTDNENSRFKIRLDDETPDTGFQEELEDQRIEKLSRRITLVSILIPCFLCVIFFVAYLDIKKRVTGMHVTGETLSQDLGAKISALDESINKTTSSMQKELNETTTAIKYIRSARKADNKKFNALTDTIEKKLESACKDLEITASKIKMLDSDFKKELVDVSKGLNKAKKELNKLQTDIATLSSGRINKKMLDLALKKEQKIYQQKLDKTAKGLEDKIKSIQKSLKKIKAEIVPPKPGDIIEQNIKE